MWRHASKVSSFLVLNKPFSGTSLFSLCVTHENLPQYIGPFLALNLRSPSQSTLSFVESTKPLYYPRRNKIMNIFLSTFVSELVFYINWTTLSTNKFKASIQKDQWVSFCAKCHLQSVSFTRPMHIGCDNLCRQKWHWCNEQMLIEQNANREKATDWNQKWTFRMPGLWYPPNLEINRLY